MSEIAAALLRDVPRYDQYGIRLSGRENTPNDETSLVLSDILAALSAALDGVDERAKWIVERLRAMPIRGGLHGITTASHAADLITALLAQNAAIREAWEKAYWRMRSYAVHDNDCKLNKPPHFDGPCSCGLTAALEDALALIQMEEQK